MYNSMVSLDYNYMMSEFLGEYGISEVDLKETFKNINEKIEGEEFKATRESYSDDLVVEEITALSNKIRERAESLVVLGIGSLGLASKALQYAINSPYYNELPKEERKAPRLYFYDSIDPKTFNEILRACDLKTTIFDFIIKSEDNIEAVSQFIIIKDILEKSLGKNEAVKHLICTTDSNNFELIKLIKEEGYTIFIIPYKIGNRLSPIELLPASAVGIDIKEVIRGRAYMNGIIKSGKPYENPAYMLGMLIYLGIKRGKNTIAIIPYADSLRLVGEWFLRLWEEFINDKTLKNPINALYIAEKHSKIHTSKEASNDKIIIFLGVDRFKSDIKVPYDSKIEALSFLEGVNYSHILQAKRSSTEYELIKLNKMNMSIILDEINEFTIGQTLYMLEVAIDFLGFLLDIDTLYRTNTRVDLYSDIFGERLKGEKDLIKKVKYTI